MSIKLSNQNGTQKGLIFKNKSNLNGESSLTFNDFKYLSYIGGTPTAAYSVRKVVGDYRGSVVRVRRSSDNDECDVLFDGGQITLNSRVTNFKDGSTSISNNLGEFVGVNGNPDGLGSPTDGFVVVWYDQAGSNDATQTTAADQPKIVNAGALVTENGKAALDFDSQFLTVPSSTDKFNYLHDGTSSSVFLTATAGKVANPDTPYGYIGNDGGSTSKIGASIFYDDRSPSRNNASVLSVLRGSSGNPAVSLIDNDKITPQSQTLITSFIDADNATASNRAKLGIDGGALYGNNTFTNAPVSTNATHNFQIGAIGNDVAPLVGYLQELIIYNSDKSALRTAIEGNIASYFDITLS